MEVLASISKLFIEMESEIGTRDLANLVLEALTKAISDLKLSNYKDFCKQFNNLLTCIKNTQPRFGLIIDDYYQIWLALEEAKQKRIKGFSSKKKYCECKNIILEIIEELQKKNSTHKEALIKYGVKTVENGDSILIHSRSHTVLDVLLQAKKKKRQFSCIVAEQDYSKTQEIIYNLHQAKIPFRVIPEHMLAHIEDEVNKVFVGGLTLNSFNNVVGDIGMNGLVSEFSNKVPIYLFISTRKFSFWSAESLHHSYKEKQVRSHIYHSFSYLRVKFSHDRVPLNLFKFVVTEKKIFTSQEMMNWYKAEFKKRATWRKKFIK